MRRDTCNVIDSFVGECPPLVEVILKALWSSIVSHQKCGSSVFARQYFDVAGSRHDVVMRFIRIRTQPKPALHFSIGLRHELHQAHGPGAGRDGLAVQILVPPGFLVNDRSDPRFGNREAIGRLLNVWTPGITGCARCFVSAVCRVIPIVGRGLRGASSEQESCQEKASSVQENGPLPARHKPDVNLFLE